MNSGNTLSRFWGVHLLIFSTLIFLFLFALQGKGTAASLSTPTAFDCSSVSEIPQAECNALVGLFNTTNGNTWVNQTNWLLTTTPCSWFGITCLNGHVSEVRLSQNQLSGPFPPEITSLTELQVLQIAENQLTGSIPAQLDALTRLTYLSIWGNQLNGTLPANLGNLSNLTNLYMGKNQFSGSIPKEIGNLTQLTVWICDRNQLTGSIPPEIGNLTHLNTLILERNELTGPVPATIGNLTQLTTLAMWGNKLEGELPASLGNLTNLTGFFMGINLFSGAIPSELGNLTKLTTFYLDGNQLSGEIPPSLANMTQASTFNLNYNKLTASDATLLNFLAQKNPEWSTTQTLPPANLRVTSTTTKTVRLEWDPIAYRADTGWYQVEFATNATGPFTLHGETFTKNDHDYNALNLMPNVTYYFRVRTYNQAHDKNWENDLTSAPSNVVEVKTLAEQTSFGCNQVSEIPSSECTALVKLYESTNGTGWVNRSGWLSTNAPCTWQGISCFANHVSNVDLSYNNLLGPLPSELAQLTDLVQLKLNNNQLNGPIPLALGGMASLVAIDLYDNKFSGTIPTQLGTLSNLEYLSLSRNLLEGEIPSQLGNLSKLTFLSLSVNNLSGPIPTALTDLVKLQQLRLQKTQLSGSIPAALSKLTQLQQLWLADTLLSGELPASLTALIQLDDFDFRNSNVCIPANSTLQNWLNGIATLGSTGISCTVQNADAFESDNICNAASTLPTDGTTHTHTFHVPSDQDWVKFEAKAFRTYIIDVTNKGAQADATLELFDSCESAANSQSNGSFGSTVRLEWNSPRNGNYYLKLQQFDPAVAGAATAYEVTITTDTTAPSTPKSIRCISIDNTTLGLQWQRSPEFDVTRYRISYTTLGSAGSEDVDGANTTYYELSGLNTNQTYTLRVRALDFSGNESLPSGEVQCIVSTPPDQTKPVITLQQPGETTIFSTTQPNLTVLGLVQDAGNNLSRVQVRNNTSNSEKADYSLSGGNQSFRVEGLPLAIGDNSVTVAAYDAAGNHTDRTLTIKRLGDTPGAVIIVAGRNDVNSLQLNIYNAANRVFRIFRAAGYSADNIYYLAPVAQDADGDNNNDVDATANPAALQEAITVWAKAGRVGPNQPLFLYMVDHGLSELFCVDGCVAAGQIKPKALDGWLNKLEQATGVSNITLVIEACLSGSFIDRANGDVESSLSRNGRVIITSTGSTNNAYASAQGAYFSDAFFSCIADSDHLKACYEQARTAVLATGVNQTPMLDDNGDGLSNSSDGTVAQARYVTRFFGSVRPTIDSATLDRQGSNGTLSAVITVGAEEVDLVWAAIYPPSFQEPNEVTLNLNVPIVRLERDPNNKNRFSVFYNNGFSKAGDYRVVIYAQDRSGINALPKVVGTNAATEQRTYLPAVRR